MTILIRLCNCIQTVFDNIRAPFDFSAPLLFRIFLAPIFIKAGYGKLQLGEDVGFFQRFTASPDIVAWFGNPEWGLGLPSPELMALLAGWTEFLGGWLLLVGLLTRYIAIPLMITMVVAAVTVHWDKGWHTLPDARLTAPWEWRKDIITEANIRKERAIQVLERYSNYRWITEYGKVTILKNGVEFAAIYFLMLLSLFFSGAGRIFSIDYWIAQKYKDPVPI